jgi:PAS domain-containing protein
MLPLPIVVSKHLDDTLNHAVIFMNDKFIEQLGWTCDDVPDKRTWWQKLYPNPEYQKVVERQWELKVSMALEGEESFVSLDVNITSKAGELKRYKVYTEMKSQLVPGYYVVAFEPLFHGFI